MSSVGMLAACGLLYVTATQSTIITPADRARAYGAVEHIAQQVGAERQKEFARAYAKLMDQLVKHPEQVDELAIEIGEQCQVVAGLREVAE